jgi:hypothetical protein
MKHRCWQLTERPWAMGWFCCFLQETMLFTSK